MLFTSTLLAMAMQVGPNPAPLLPGDGHAELRDRAPRAQDDAAPINPASQWLKECLDQLDEDASRAHTMAQIQRNITTGDERVLANHCLGLAATQLARWSEAVEAFAEARHDIPQTDPRARSRFAAMAGNAQLAGDDPAQAAAYFRLAKTDAQQAASATLEAIASIDLARALVGMGETAQALAALDDATRLAPGESEGWLLKGTLLRRMERFDEAQLAIERAGELAPTNVEIGLEAGVIAVLSGRPEAARESWLSVVEIQPESLAAQIARDYLAQLGEPAPQETAPDTISSETPL